MPKTEFAKEFSTLLDDFDVATQRAIKSLEHDDNFDAVDLDHDGVLDGSLDRLVLRVKRDCLLLDRESVELERARKKQDAEAKKTKGAKAEKEKLDEATDEALDTYKNLSEKLERSLEAFAIAVRSQLVTRKDLGEKFVKAAGTLHTDVKKLDIAVDKAVSAQLKRKPREVKKQQVIPSKFLADFKDILKKHPIEDEDSKVERAVKEAEDRVKRCDANSDFDNVTKLCEMAQTTLKELMKQAGKANPKLVPELKDLIAAIDKYDNHMFLLNR